MKKEFILIIFLLVPLCSAVDISFSKDSYQPQELIQIEITGYFISFSSENVQIYHNDKVHAEPLIKDMTKQNNVYYVYAIAPTQGGNYSFRIEGATYFEKNELKKDTLSWNLTIQEKNTSALFINPGFVIPSKDFSIKVKSLYKNIELMADFPATGETKKSFLIEGIEEIFTFSLPVSPAANSAVTINDYKIPVFLLKKSNVSQETLLEFFPFEVRDTIVRGKDYTYAFVLKNPSKKNLTNVELSTNLEVVNPTLTPANITLLKAGEAKVINLTFSVSPIMMKNISGSVKIITANESFSLPVSFIVHSQGIPSSNATSNTSTGPRPFNCAQIGVLCKENEVCTGETTASIEGACCIGDCVIEEQSNTKTIVGFVLVGILLIIVAYVGYNIYKRRKLKTPEEILREKSDRFSERIKGREVRGNLDRF